MRGKKNTKKVVWILDSGCSKHMTDEMVLISKFEKKAGLLVIFGDDIIGTTKWYGNLKSKNVIIEDIILVKGLKYNLLSISQFIDIDFKIELIKDKCLIFQVKNGEFLSGVRKGSLSITDLDSANKDNILLLF